MPRLAQAYRAMLKAAVGRMLEYRAQMVLWILGSVFPLVMMAVWLAVVDEAGPLAGWGRADFMAYYVGAAVINQLTFAWISWDWDEAIRSGELSVRLLKPLDPIHHYVVEQLGWKIFLLVFIVPIVAAVAWLSPTLNFSLTPLRLGLTILATMAGLALSIVMGSAFGMIAFWSTQSGNLFGLWHGAGQFLSGWIAPLAMFPAGIRSLGHWLPFRTVLGFPTEILVGRLSAAEIAFGFAVSGGWIAFFFVVYRSLWRAGLKRYEAVGA